jgi:hypothetical protein
MWLAGDGAVQKTLDLPSREFENDSRFDEYLAAVLMPPAMAAVLPLVEDAALPLQKHRLRAVLCVVCSAAIYLSLVFWFCRRYSLSARSTCGWMIFLLFTGVPGLLAFFGLQEWPAREACPSCHKLRIVTRETCEHCAAPFNPPQKIGIEIFEPA